MKTTPGGRIRDDTKAKVKKIMKAIEEGARAEPPKPPLPMGLIITVGVCAFVIGVFVGQL